MYLSNKHEKIYFNKLTAQLFAFVFKCMVTVFYIYYIVSKYIYKYYIIGDTICINKLYICMQYIQLFERHFNASMSPTYSPAKSVFLFQFFYK